MKRVVRLEPGHEWNGKYAVMSDQQQHLYVPVLVKPIVIDWTGVGTTAIDTSYETQHWIVVRLPHEVARWYRSDLALIGPAMQLLAITDSWPQPMPGVW
jgi:hypothetical protein